MTWSKEDLARFDAEAAQPSKDRDASIKDDALLTERRALIATLEPGEVLDTTITIEPKGAGMVWADGQAKRAAQMKTETLAQSAEEQKP